MNILLTGGAGFIGASLAEVLLNRGDTLQIIDDFNDYYDPEIKYWNIKSLEKCGEFRVIEGNICNREALNQIDWSKIDKVINLAARAGVRPSLTEPHLYYKTNVEGLLNLLELSRENNIKHILSASSSSVYGDSAKPPFSEDDPAPNPISPYAATKRAGELLTYTYCHLYGMHISNMRYFTVYGPRQRPEMAIHKFTRIIENGDEIEMYGDGESYRDYTYIDDIVAGSVRALDRLNGYKIYNLGESQTTRLSDLINLIGDVLGKKPNIKKLPMQPGDVLRTFADISKARTELDYNPKTDMKTGIENFVSWYFKAKEEGVLK